MVEYVSEGEAGGHSLLQSTASRSVSLGHVTQRPVDERLGVGRDEGREGVVVGGEFSGRGNVSVGRLLPRALHLVLERVHIRLLLRRQRRVDARHHLRKREREGMGMVG